MKNKKLLPCPFCGGEAEFYRTAIKTNGSWCDSVVVRCKVCKARANRVLYDAKKHPNCEEYEEARTAWNTRTKTIPVGNGENYEVTHND